MLHGKVSWPSKGYLWLRIAASGPHPQTDLYIYFLITVNANIYYTYIHISFSFSLFSCIYLTFLCHAHISVIS